MAVVILIAYRLLGWIGLPWWGVLGSRHHWYRLGCWWDPVTLCQWVDQTKAIGAAGGAPLASKGNILPYGI